MNYISIIMHPDHKHKRQLNKLMDMRKFVIQKRKHESNDSSSEDEGSPTEVTVSQSQPKATSSQAIDKDVGTADLQKSQRKRIHKSRLSYRKEWEQEYPWVSCTNVEEGMFCTFCQKSGNSPVTARGAWTTRGIKDWNHATELLKLHNESKWHRDSTVYVQMAEQGEKQNIIQLQSAAIAKEQEEQRVKNRAVLLKLLRSVYFVAKNRLPLTTIYKEVVQLQVKNGDANLKQHLDQGPRNAQYVSNFSVVMLMEAIDTWLEQRLLQSLKESSHFTILADECEDITTAEELSICGGGLSMEGQKNIFSQYFTSQLKIQYWPKKVHVFTL